MISKSDIIVKIVLTCCVKAVLSVVAKKLFQDTKPSMPWWRGCCSSKIVVYKAPCIDC